MNAFEISCVDLFAGAGGFTEGATMAGARVLYAANHDPLAVAIHQANHPDAIHECQDLRQADFTKLPDHGILLASPCCTGFSKARGTDKPHHDKLRATAWAVIDALECKRPEGFIVENVSEFQDWLLFPMWRACLEALGYKLTVRVENAADWGVPQSRVRLFIVGARKKAPVIETPKTPHQAASTIIQWEAGDWSFIDPKKRAKPLAERTMAQIINGRKVHGDRFLIAYYGSEKQGRSLLKPLGTLTTRATFAVVDGDRLRMLTVDEQKAAMTFRPDYQLPPVKAQAEKLIGNAVPPLLVKGLVGQLASQVA